MAKRLQELTIIDDFMFGAVMSNKENCRLLLERILDIPIDHVEVTNEKTISYHPGYKGIRLDVYAKDENNTRYNVEMQVRRTPIFKRSRYYHAQIDMDLLLKGVEYDKLPDTYVIFICDYDPFGMQKYRYTIEKSIVECPDFPVNDGVHTIILNNRGQNPEDISPELLSFLNFTKATLEESDERSDDAYVTQIQRSIRQIKHDREMENQYMFTEFLIKEKQKAAVEEALREAREEIRIKAEEEVREEIRIKAEEEVREEIRIKAKEEIREIRIKAEEEVREASIKAREEGIDQEQQRLLTNFLSRLGEIPSVLLDDIQSIKNPEIMQELILQAARATSIKDFQEVIGELKLTK